MNKEALVQAIRAVVPGVAKRSCNLPIIHNLRITQCGWHARLRTTDLDHQISVSVHTGNSECWDTVVPPKALLDTVSSLQGDVTLRHNDDKLHIGDTATLSCVADPDDWPNWVDSTSASFHLEVPVKPFVKTLDQAVKTTRDMDGALSCVFFNGKAKRVTSSDGHRVNHQEVGWLSAKVKALVPRASVKALTKALKAAKVKGELTLSFCDNLFKVRSEEIFSFVCRLFDGTFPETDKLPRADGPFVRMDRDDAVLGFKQMVALHRGTREVRVNLHPTDHGIVLAAENAEYGYAEYWVDTDVDLEGHFGCPISINGQYVLDALKRCDSGTVTLRLSTNPEGPVEVNGEMIMLMRGGGDYWLPSLLDNPPACASKYVPVSPSKTVKKTRKAKKVKRPKNNVRALPPEIKYDWLADVDEKSYQWKWNKTVSAKYPGQWVKAAA
jgi:DNA polymerase III sliding clamp (beta) subunit (PCNA family)